MLAINKAKVCVTSNAWMSKSVVRIHSPSPFVSYPFARRDTRLKMVYGYLSPFRPTFQAFLNVLLSPHFKIFQFLTTLHSPKITNFKPLKVEKSSVLKSNIWSNFSSKSLNWTKNHPKSVLLEDLKFGSSPFSRPLFSFGPQNHTKMKVGHTPGPFVHCWKKINLPRKLHSSKPNFPQLTMWFYVQKCQISLQIPTFLCNAMSFINSTPLPYP